METVNDAVLPQSNKSPQSSQVCCFTRAGGNIKLITENVLLCTDIEVVSDKIKATLKVLLTYCKKLL